MYFTDDELLQLAGPGAFERGYYYYQQGHVGDIEIRVGKIVALVSGTDVYRVELYYDAAGLNGSCSCPASDGVVFCKHCVATALILRESALATTNGADDRALQAFLAEQDAETLVSWLMRILPKDPALYERLHRQAMLAANTLDAKELKKSITQVTPLQDIFEWGRVSAYFRRLEATLEGIVEIADQLPADVLLDTTLHGIKRLNKALERVDDSGGYRAQAQALLRELHCKALQRVGWAPQKRAKHLLELALADPWDQFEAMPMDYADALGDAGLGAFYEVVEARFNALPAPRTHASFDDSLPYLRLRNYLMVQARERNDFDELIRLEKLTAATATDFANIARLYLKNGKPENAANWLSKADSLDKHDRNGRKALWASVHVASGDWKAAIEAQEAAFQRNASYNDYRELMSLAEQAGRAADIRRSVFRFLRSKERALLWSDERRAWTLARILKEDQEWDALAETALTRINDSDRLMKVARWIAKSKLVDAGPVFERAIDALVQRKTNRSYRAAVRALREARPAFDAACPSAFDECVSRLRRTHFRKRNFMGALDEEIGAA